MGANSILKQIGDRFYIHTCKVTNVDKNIQHHMHLYTTVILDNLEKKIAALPLLMTEKMHLFVLFATIIESQNRI